MIEQTPWIWPLCPTAPDWELAWEAICNAIPLLKDLAACRQDPVFHAEGDVLTHTRMVCQALSSMVAWRALPAESRSLIFLGALLHDVGKPSCTKTESDGRVSSRGHALRGALISRAAIYRELSESLRIPPSLREQIVALVRYHGLPLAFVDKPDPTRSIIAASMTARCDWLALVAEADVLGRLCGGQDQLVQRVRLFEEFCLEHGVTCSAHAFASDQARFTYFTDGRSGATYEPFDTSRCNMTLMSGLPGSGKDTFIRNHYPNRELVSLDAIRAELDIEPADEQGPVVSEARQRAIAAVRSGRDVIWNATNVTRSMRDSLVAIFAAYRARVEIVYVETDYRTLLRRNANDRVPRRVIERLIDRLEPPDLTEAHRVVWHLSAGR